MTVDAERVARALEWVDKVTAPGAGFSAVTIRVGLLELAELIRDLTEQREGAPRPGETDRSGGGHRALGDSAGWVVSLTGDHNTPDVTMPPCR